MTEWTPEIGDAESTGGPLPGRPGAEAEWAPEPTGDPVRPDWADDLAPAAPGPGRAGARRSRSSGSGRGRSANPALQALRRRERIDVSGGTALVLLVLACHREDTTAVDLASGTLVRARVPWPDDHTPDLDAFDVVEARLAEEPERDDLAQPEAVTPTGLPRHVGTLRGRRVRHMLQRLAVAPGGPLLGFPGPSAPYWEFRGLRPSVALVKAARDPQLLRRPTDGSTWVRFGWERDDVWLPVEDRRAVRALDASRADRLAGKALATAMGFTPQYLVAAVSGPRDGHCYKLCTALLPKE